MKIIEVIPILKNTMRDTLSYISGKDFEVGQIINIPIRKKIEKAVIKEIKNIEDQKIDIKSSDFALKKIPDDTKIYKTKVPEYFIESLEEIAKYFAKTVGSIIKRFIPEEYIENELKIEEGVRSGQFDIMAISALTEERIDIYKSLIRESFAKKESIAIILPTEVSKNLFYEQLKKGIENFTLVFEDQSKKKFKEFFKKYSEEQHPLLIISKDKILSILNPNIKTIIIEEEGSRFYKDNNTPYCDTRVVSEIVAKKKKIRLILGDTILSISTTKRIKSGEISEYGNILSKIHHPIKTIVVDQKSKDKEEGFKIISSELEEMLKYGKAKNKKIFIYVNRKGLAPHTLCRDCGTVVTCKNCEAPLVLYKNKTNSSNNFFLCHHCGKKQDAHIKCKNCDGFQLDSFGFGSQKLTEEIERITDTKPFIIDNDETPNRIRDTLKNWQNKKGVIVGTELALDYIKKEESDYSVISSIDSLLSIPDISIGEKVFRIITKTKLIAEDCFLIQGRNTKLSVIENAVSGDVATFFREELEMRESFSLPPFAKIIKITLTGEKAKIQKETELMHEYLKKWNPFSFPAFIKTVRGQTLSHIIIKLPAKKDIETELLTKLLSLPPYMKVKVDPESLI